ncbi:MAG TPA: hypothetical protein V6C52_11505 [Coleofasciculaceae cyanobacterium]|jgi:hypothetical protein
MSLYNLLGKLEQQTLWDTMTKEFLGVNLPRIVFTRTQDERWDSAVNEIGNSIAIFGIGGLLDQGLKRLYQTVQAQGGNAAKWSVVCRSGALYSAIFSLMWAMPFARNYLTARRTGKTVFTDVIGSCNSAIAGHQDNVQESMTNSKRRFWKILALGGAATALFAFGGRWAAGKNMSLGLLKRLFQSKGAQDFLLLKDGSFEDYSGWKAVLSCAVPAYAGWYDAARDPYEKKEQILKFVSFVTGFLGPGFCLKHYFKNTFAQLLPNGVLPTYQSIKAALKMESNPLIKANLEQALGTWKKKTLWTLLSSIALLTATQFLNFHLTGKRLAKARARQAGASPALTSGGLHRKTIADWGYRPAVPVASPWQDISTSYQATPYGPRW